MIDLTKLKAPGWQRVVGELTTPAGDDRAFLTKLTVILGQVTAARQAVLFSFDASAGDGAGEARALLGWTSEGGVESPLSEERVERRREVASAVRSAGASGQTRVYGLEDDDGLYTDEKPGYVVAACVPRKEQGGAVQVIAMVLDHRSRQALQTTLALVEVLLGYTHSHALTQALRRATASSAALDLATRLIASINQAPGFKGACMQLVNDLARQLGLDRVALGWVRGVGRSSGVVRVVAISDTEQIDRRMEMVRKIERAMDECLDQEQAVLHPAPPEDEDMALSQAITHEHRALAAGDAQLRVASVPLRDGDEIVGVLTVERSGDESALDARLVEWLQAAMDLVTPVLRVRRSDDRMLAVRAWGSLMRGGAWLVGPKHTAWKLAGLALLAVVLVVTFVRVPYRVEAPFELQARVQRVLSAPFAGVIDSLGEGIEKGAQVRAGDVVLRMRTTELELALQQAITQRLQAQTRADDAMESGDAFEQQQALQEVAAAQAQIDLLTHRLERAVIRSPIDGVIVDGDLERRIGSTVTLGEPLAVVARIDDLEVVGRVDDRDISYIEDHMRGLLARKSRPSERIPMVIERIVPLAKPVDGANVFEIRGAIDFEALDREEAEALRRGLRPGMEGLAKLDTGERTIAWILSRRVRDTLRMWLWW